MQLIKRPIPAYIHFQIICIFSVENISPSLHQPKQMHQHVHLRQNAHLQSQKASV